jgi:hypothetical protein
MRRTGIVLALLFGVAAASLPAIGRGDFDRVVDFSVTLKTLAAAADGATALPTARMLVLSGTVSSIAILNKDEPTFKVRIELIAGEWFGTEDVKAYACYVDFSGPEYFAAFPPRAPAQPGPGVIVQSVRVLVAGRALSIVTTPLGDKRVLLEGAYVRAIE